MRAIVVTFLDSLIPLIEGKAQCPRNELWPILSHVATMDPDMADDMRVAYCEVYEEVMADNPYHGLTPAAREKKWMEETLWLINEYTLVKGEFYKKALAEKVDSVDRKQVEAEIHAECERRGIRPLRPIDEYYERRLIKVKAAWLNR